MLVLVLSHLLEKLIHLCSSLFYLKIVQECLVFYDPSLNGHGAIIYGEHEQSTLEHAHICVLNCKLIGSKALKNSMLGIIGSFIVDDTSKVYASELGNNYFSRLFFLFYISSLA